MTQDRDAKARAIEYSAHARDQMEQRGISQNELGDAVRNPTVLESAGTRTWIAFKRQDCRVVAVVYDSETDTTVLKIVTACWRVSSMTEIGLKYDAESDCIYVRIAPGNVARRKKLSAHVLVDFGTLQQVLAVEVIHASESGVDVDALIMNVKLAVERSIQPTVPNLNLASA